MSSQSERITATTRPRCQPITWGRNGSAQSAVLVLLLFFSSFLSSSFSFSLPLMQKRIAFKLEHPDRSDAELNPSSSSAQRRPACLPRRSPLITQFLPNWNRLPPTSSERAKPIPGLRSRAVGGEEVAGRRDGERRRSGRAWRTGRTGAGVQLRFVQPGLNVSQRMRVKKKKKKKILMMTMLQVSRYSLSERIC